MNELPDNYINIDDLISFEGFSFGEYFKGEQEIIKPQLEAKGYTDIIFYTEDGDYFGPLVRGIEMKKDGKKYCSSYG